MCVCSCRLGDSVTRLMLADRIKPVCLKIPIKSIDFSYKLHKPAENAGLSSAGHSSKRFVSRVYPNALPKAFDFVNVAKVVAWPGVKATVTGTKISESTPVCGKVSLPALYRRACAQTGLCMTFYLFTVYIRIDVLATAPDALVYMLLLRTKPRIDRPQFLIETPLLPPISARGRNSDHQCQRQENSSGGI